MKQTVAELDIARRVLELARAAAGPGAEIDAFVETTDLALTRFANSYIHQNVADRTTTAVLRLHAEGRTVSASTTLTGADALAALVERTALAAKVAPLDRAWPGLAPAAAAPRGADPDPAIVQASPADRAHRVRAFIEACDGLPSAGYCRTRVVTSAYANSAGQSLEDRLAEAALDGIARTPTADGASRQASRRLADLDGTVHGSRAAAKARAAAEPTDLEPGEYEVVLEPAAVSDILLCLGDHGFNGKSVNEGTSFLAVGAAQFDASVTMVDDPLSGPAAGALFDTEGTPRPRLVLVEDGVSVAAPYDRRSAQEAGLASTGHCGEASAVYGPRPLNLRLQRSGGSPDAAPVTEAEGPVSDSATLDLVRGMRRGLLVSDHWYTRCLDPRRLVMTGLTRNGVWLVEDGEIVRPVRNLRFTQSYPEALAPGRVLGIGAHSVAFASKYGVHSPMAPALHLAGWRFTGGSAG